jgi:hypothetical protein
MATPNSSFSDIITTSLQGYSGQIADNITNHNALLRQIDRKGNKQVATGRTIVQEIDFAENQTVQYYAGSETLDTTQSEVLTAAEFNYKQLAGTVVINGLEEIQNSVAKPFTTCSRPVSPTWSARCATRLHGPLCTWHGIGRQVDWWFAASRC